MRYFFYSLFFCALLVSAPVLAAPAGAGSLIAPPGDGALVGPPGAKSVTIDNPIKADTIQELFKAILGIILVFAVPIIVFFIIFAGFKYVMAQGNSEAISEANKMLLYALIGGVLILGANVLIEVIQGTVDSITETKR